MPRRPARPHPELPILEAEKVAQGIRDNNAGHPMNRVLLAQSLGRSPSGSGFRQLISASLNYGFTTGNYSSEVIQLTDLGEQLTIPRDQTERLEARRQGFLSIPLFEQLANHFNNAKLPAAEFLKNTLEREPFNVDARWSEEAAGVFVANGRAVGYIRDVGGSDYVVLEAGPPVEPFRPDVVSADAPEPPPQPPQVVEDSVDAVIGSERADAGAVKPSPPESSQLQFFIAHGHDRDAVQDVQRIMDELGIPYVVAVDEANAGRPISQKVKDLMDACSAGIFIFSADEEFKDSEGTVIFRPRENVIYELGAASYKYGRHIVIFKEKDVSFPSDFSDLGYIEFEKGQLRGKSMELLRELIALKAVRLLPGS